jgi:hypothetical protein
MSWDRGAPTPVVLNSHQARETRDCGPSWTCTCGNSVAADLSHCPKCSRLKPMERVMRLQVRAIQGLGRGGGYFERGDPSDRYQVSDEIEEKGGFDVYGRRRLTQSELAEEGGHGKDCGEINTSHATASANPATEGGAPKSAVGASSSKADRQRAALERLRNPAKLRTCLSPPRTRTYREPSSRSRERKQRRSSGFAFSGGLK